MKDHLIPVSGTGRIRAFFSRVHDRLFLYLLHRFVPSVYHAPLLAHPGRKACFSPKAKMPSPSLVSDRSRNLMALSDCLQEPDQEHACADCCRQTPGFLVLRVNGQPFGGYPFSFN